MERTDTFPGPIVAKILQRMAGGPGGLVLIVAKSTGQREEKADLCDCSNFTDVFAHIEETFILLKEHGYPVRRKEQQK